MSRAKLVVLLVVVGLTGTGAVIQRAVAQRPATMAQAEEAALGLLRSVVSLDGFQKVMNIVHADQVLEERSAPTRAADSRIRVGRAEFYIAILGTPFAWSWPTGQGQGAHFRIQGPTILIEYASQGKPSNDTDQIHTIYRDPTNDYAAK